MMVALSEIIETLESGMSVNSDDSPAEGSERGVLKVSSVAEGRFFPKENKRILPAEASRVSVSVNAGDLLVSRANTFDLIGACGVVDGEYPNLFLPDKLWRVVLRDGGRDSIAWLKHVLNSPSVRAELKKRATGTSGSMKNIPQTSFLAIHVFRPPFREQETTANVLDVWDRGIQHVSEVIAAKLRFKQGLTQQLLAGERRFGGFADEWRTVQLNDVTEECDERNRGRFANASVMAVTKAEGIIPMRERSIAAVIDRYQIVRKDWFAYNPMRINIGSIARHFGADDVLVSPDYVVFKCKQDECGEPLVDPDYLDHLRRSYIWKRFVTAAGNGSVRIRIYFSDLGHLKFKLPSPVEQRPIADLLNTADREIDLLRKQLAAFKDQKKGLMQKLLTGRIRVGVP